ncbi:hypothetical protein X975_16689, partial [Stegodyphus mimosarum]
MEDFRKSSDLLSKRINHKSTITFLFWTAGLLFVVVVLCSHADAKKWTMEELAAARFPHKVSNDIYLDPCKS